MDGILTPDAVASHLEHASESPTAALRASARFCTQSESSKAHPHTSGRLDCPRYAQNSTPERSPPLDLFASPVDPGIVLDADESNPRQMAAQFVAAAFPWQIMLTVTNSPYGGEKVTATAPGAHESRPHFVSDGAADKRFSNGMNRLNRMIFGQRYWQRRGYGMTWAGTMEYQKSGNPHHHALLYSPATDRLALLEVKIFASGKVILPQIEHCFRDAGAGPVIRAEVCCKPGQAAAYITKACRYVTKTDGLSYGGPWPGISLSEG